LKVPQCLLLTQSGHRSPYSAGQTFSILREERRLVARQFVAWLGVPPNKDWLDVGSGTGALCEVILAGASPHQVMGVDPSDGFVSFARHKVTDKRATFQICF